LTATSTAGPPSAEVRNGSARRLSRRAQGGIVTAALLLAVSLAIVLLAKTRPSFDSYGWLVWGHQTLAGALNTNAAPSWKPLPYLFTVPFALFGHYEMWLWMITCVAISLGGALAAGRITYRLTVGAAAAAVAAPPSAGRPRQTPRALHYGAIAAGVFAALALLGIRDWWHYMLSAQSDTIVVALCLGAIDCHLSGRPRWAFALGALASLGRPEVWPFLGLYSLWAWRAIPSMRWLIGGGIVVLVLLWFGIPALTSRSPFVAASNAIGSGRRLRSNRVFGTIDRFLDLHETPLEIAALLSLCWAAIRRDVVILALAAGAFAYVVIEIAFALHGWPGLGRYMFAPAGVMVAIAAVFVGRLLGELPRLVAERFGAGRLSSASAWAGIALAVAIVAGLIPAAVSRARIERRDIHVQRARTKEIDRLAGIVTRLGGSGRLNACGEPLTRLEYQTILAWTLHVNVARIGFKYGEAINHGNPIVLFTPLPQGGWKVQALHQRLHSCMSLPH
jgi:hypothetical protein